MSERPRDSFWSRVRNAESQFTINHPEPLSYAQQKALCDRIVKSPWWKKRRPDILVFSVRHTGRTNNYCTTEMQNVRGLKPVAVIDIGSPDTGIPGVLHAVAHYLHPENTAWHGAEYAKAMLDIVGKFMGMDARRELAGLYKAHNVKTVQWSNEAKERAKVRHAERDLKVLLDELKPSDPVTPSS